MIKIILVAGPRPNFMKIAPLYDELKSREIPVILLHTGQHYDENMSKIFFDELGMPKPDIYLGVGSASHAKQTAKIICRLLQFIYANYHSLPINKLIKDRLMNKNSGSA